MELVIGLRFYLGPKDALNIFCKDNFFFKKQSPKLHEFIFVEVYEFAGAVMYVLNYMSSAVFSE